MFTPVDTALINFTFASPKEKGCISALEIGIEKASSEQYIKRIIELTKEVSDLKKQIKKIKKGVR